jgi:hypothetical protein
VSLHERLRRLETQAERVNPDHGDAAGPHSVDVLRGMPADDLIRLYREELNRPVRRADPAEVERLRRLPEGELRRRYREAFGAEAA